MYATELTKSVSAIPKVFLQGNTPSPSCELPTKQMATIRSGTETEICVLDDGNETHGNTCREQVTDIRLTSAMTTETYLSNTTHVRRLSINSIGGIIGEGKCSSPRTYSPKSPGYREI